jgi:DNA-binding beta-propeller fold protein YncE
MKGRMRMGRIAVLGAGIAGVSAAIAVAATGTLQVGPTDKVTANLRHLDPYGRLTQVGNFPGGSALTPDGRFYWTVSAGWGENGVQIVDVDSGDVLQTIKLPGASGGVTIDGVHHLAYVSGEPNTDIGEYKTADDAPGAGGDVIHVFSYDPASGEATPQDVIPVPPPSSAPPTDSFPPNVPPKQQSWPERLAVSPDGSMLLVALGLADAAAVIDTQTKAVRYVATGSHPFGAAILPDGKTGLISNRGGVGASTVSVIDLNAASKVKDIDIGPHLSHPEEITLDATRPRAYVPLANADAVGVIDTDSLESIGGLDVTVPQGAGGAPLSTAVTPDGSRLLVAQSAADEISVYGFDGGHPKDLLGRIPTADYPTDVSVAAKTSCSIPPGNGNGGGGAAAGSNATGGSTTPPKRKRKHKKGRKHAKRSSVAAGSTATQASQSAATCPSTLLWTAAKGFGLGPNAGPPITSQYFDIPPELTTKGKVTGYAGIGPMPTNSELPVLTDRATKQLESINAEAAPADTPLRPNGPIKHVFYIVKENRTYDQVLGDVSRGDGDPNYAIFGNQVTPNAHALVDRFPLLDHFYADSEASIDGHYWTAAADTSDYVHRTWRPNYAGRDYPSDAWFYQIAYPQTGFLFDRASEQNVSYVNLGEGVAHIIPTAGPADRDKDAADEAASASRLSHTDLGPYTGGCYDPFIGTDDLANAAHIPVRTYDSSKPAGAPEPSVSRFDCFKTKFQAWSATDTLPQLVYMTLPNDHTNGGTPGRHTPRAMVADNDEALGQVVDLISHSKYWDSSAIFVMEDDSQDGFDHQDAHRIPAFVISPYAKDGVISTPYDMVSAIRSMEVILGLHPLNLFDSQATPMYDAFTGSPDNSDPFSAVPPTYDLLEENSSSASTAAARQSSKYDLTIPDQISQADLDRIVWESVHGPNSSPPPAGPNADTGG